MTETGHFTYEVEEGLQADCDADLIRSALQELVGNACKFTVPGRPCRVKIGKTDRGGQAVFFVEDNGRGFSMDYADRIFDPFERISPNDGTVGTGVGLAIAKRIIEAHDGRLWAQSAEGQGTTFYFTLPA